MTVNQTPSDPAWMSARIAHYSYDTLWAKGQVTTIVDNGDGTFALSGTAVIDNGDGTFAIPASDTIGYPWHPADFWPGPDTP